MKKRVSDDQIISILREAKAGVSARELWRKHAISDATFTPGARSMAVLEVKRLKSLQEENARLRKLLAKACWVKRHFRWLWGERANDRPHAGIPYLTP